MILNVDSECQVAGVTKPTVWAARKSLAFLSFWYHNGTGAMQITKTTLRQLGVYIIIYIYMYMCMIRYVYSVDYVTCSIYVCICAAAILVLSATFELTE